MMRNHNRKAVHILRRIVRPLRIDPQKAVRKMYGGKCRHQQMTDVAYIWIDIVHRRTLLCLRASGQYSNGYAANHFCNESHSIDFYAKLRIILIPDTSVARPGLYRFALLSGHVVPG